jgi:hypothetical protein
MKKDFSLRKGRSVRAFTLVEVLTVVSVVAALLGSIASVFVLTLRSYTGEYELEAVEAQSQRACVELDYFARRSTGYSIKNSGNSSFSGDQLILTQPQTFSVLQGSGKTLGSVVFTFTPSSAPPVSGLTRGSLEVAGYTSPVLGSSAELLFYYTYSSDFRVPQNQKVFSISPEGTLSYGWELVSAGGSVSIDGLIPLR